VAEIFSAALWSLRTCPLCRYVLWCTQRWYLAIPLILHPQQMPASKLKKWGS